MSAKLAKINRPQLPQVYLRQRLFSLLDDAAPRPLTWISANAGAGKTVLMTSYLQARQLPDLWYRLDVRDADIATFFYYLRKAAQLAGLPQADTLPLLTTEYAGVETVFARNFFARLFIDAPRPLALVFDNYQDLPEDCSLPAILIEALQEIPPGIRVFILSRTVTPAALARWRANLRMTILDTSVLRLDPEETAGLLRLQSGSRTRINDELIETIHREANGWAVGVILLFEYINRFGTRNKVAQKQSREAVFHYFATELFKNASPEMRHFLCRTALVPQFDIEMACQLTERENVDVLLEELLRKNFFIYEQDARHLSYQYHPLFRDFLREIARHDGDQQHYNEMLGLAAGILRNSGQLEDAVDLYIEAGDWPTVAGIVVSEAGKLYSQGRVQQIDQWIMSIPEAVRQSIPWLDYWFGVCRTGFDLTVAREAFERASRGFQSQQDNIGRCLAAAGVVGTYIYEWGDFKPLDHWIDELDRLLDTHSSTLPPSVDAQARVALFTAYMYRQPDQPQLPTLAQQVYQIIERMPGDLLRLTAGSHLLLFYTWWQGDIARGGVLVKLLEPLAQSSCISPLLQITWLAIQATYAWMAGNTDECISSAERGLDIADRNGVHLWDFMLLAQASWAALTADHLSQARHYLERMAATVQPGRLLDLCHFHYQLFVEALHRDDIPAMDEHSTAALQLARDAGVPWAEGTVLPACARAQAAKGNRTLAARLLNETGTLAQGLHSDTIYYGELLARVELELPDDNNLDALQKLLEVSRQRGIVNASLWRSTSMSKICARALTEDIEVTFVRNLIKQRALLPQANVTFATWPWPIRIHTLGRFSLVKYDKSVTATGKVQKKPLELLKAIIAFGSRDVSETQLMEALWPDSEGDMARQSLKSTVHRLRKLLELDVLQWHEGKLGLDARYCWVDVWALERFLNNASGAPADDLTTLEQTVKQLDKLYPGAFLQGEEAAYALSLRERLRSKLLRLLTRMAAYFAQHNACDLAIATYKKGLEIEVLAEPFYLGIMQCQRALGHIAEALNTYEHYRRIIQHGLGVEPSPEIATLAKSLRTDKK